MCKRVVVVVAAAAAVGVMHGMGGFVLLPCLPCLFAMPWRRVESNESPASRRACEELA